MKPLATLLTSTLLASTLVACNQAPPDTHDADVKSLRDTETQWNQDFASKDAAKITAHYADDAVLIDPGSPAITGKDAIASAIKEMVADPALSLKFQTNKVDVARSGDVGFTEGSYQFAMTDPQSKQVINDHGSYATTYRKQPDGSWKAVVDIASSAVPPPAPAPPPPTKKH